MFKIQRCRLGSSITKSPAQEMQRWTVNNIARILFGIAACVVWFGLVYFGSSFTVFLGTNIAGFWKKGSITAMEVFNMPITGMVKIAGCIAIFIYIIHSTRQAK